jgi:hypothetical protein
MKFDTFNPSELEIQVCDALSKLTPEIQKQLVNLSIVNTAVSLNKDNPELTLNLSDKDGDMHTITISIIHRPVST